MQIFKTIAPNYKIPDEDKTHRLDRDRRKEFRKDISSLA